MTGALGWTASHPAGQGPGRVRVITDSASDILPSHAQAIGVLVMPNRIVLDGQVLRDGIDITASQFYAHLPRAKTPPSTQPAPASEFYRAYLATLQRGAAIVSIHVSSKLSQVVQQAAAAREALAPAPIEVIDSLQLGIGMWPAVTEACRLAHAGAPPDEVRAQALGLLARTHAFVLVESLDALRRSGRIGRAQELLGTLVDAHPILTLHQGEAQLVETVRGRRHAIVRLRDVACAIGDVETLLVCGTSVEAIGELETVLAERYQGPIRNTWLGPSIGANLGHAVAVAVVVRG
jgi:fatty acid kinase fatty acid binding subunit